MKKGAVQMRRLKEANQDYVLRDCYYGMLKRCYSKACKNYCLYGGRGITVAEDWRSSFAEFKTWAYANGWQKGLQIDRIDCDGPYCPENCRFVTSADNNRNRRNNKLTTEKASEIRRLSLEGFTNRKVAEMFGIDRALVWRISKNLAWRENDHG